MLAIIMYYVYVIRKLRAKIIYFGYSKNLKRRFAEHNSKQPCELIYYEAYKSESDARKREKQLKRHGQAVIHLKKRIKDSLK